MVVGGGGGDVLDDTCSWLLFCGDGFDEDEVQIDLVVAGNRSVILV